MVNLQPLLQDDSVLLKPLTEADFEILYRVASDPEIWSQHPNKNRYQRDVFQTFFQGALRSGGAYIIIDKGENVAIGGTRLYDWDAHTRTVFIGYTFFAKSYWGKGFNHRVKKLMLHHAFSFADTVIFHIGASNFRSQRSIEKLGARKTGEEEVTYFGEAPKLNFVYEITARDLED